MRTVLICHADEDLNRYGLPLWLNSISTLAGIVVIEEPPGRTRKRIRREIQRVGLFRFLDVLAFRFYYRLFLAGRDSVWERDQLSHLQRAFSPVDNSVPVLLTSSPNSSEAERFIRAAEPDIMLARCKTILKKSIFSLPSCGTFAMHPGICPEYRNAHGCFWALANNDREKVGMTLLQIDEGIDTGPVYGYFSCSYDEVNESHVVIQLRTVFDNLARLEAALKDIFAGQAKPLDVAGRQSAEWGQPWLSAFLQWKRTAREVEQ